MDKRAAIEHNMTEAVVSAAGAAFGGALLGNAIAGPVGAVIGGLVGVGAGYQSTRNDDDSRTSKDSDAPCASGH